MSLSIVLTSEEKNLAENYAKMHSLSLSDAFKRAFFRQMEDEEDQKIADEAYQEYLDSGCKSTPIEDFWKELDSENV